MAIELPADYYLTNFLQLIHHVYRQYADILNQQESDFYQDFIKLNDNAQKLYLRMLTRKGELFRASKLTYEEINNTELAAQQLAEHGFIAINTALEHEEVLSLFNKSECLSLITPLLKEPCPSLKKLKREDLDQQLLQLLKPHTPSDYLNETFYRLCRHEVFTSYRLLFFSNLHQDLTDFILRDIGQQRFEDYDIDKHYRLFQSRKQLQQHLDYYQLTEKLDDSLQDASAILQLHKALPKVEADDDTLDKRVQRCRLTLARQLERLDCPKEALEIYRLCTLCPSRERQARILVKQDEISEALAICQQIIDAPLNEEEAIFAEGFAWRTAKKHGLAANPVENYKPPSQEIALSPHDDGVEWAVALHLAAHPETPGDCYVVENTLFNSLFGLYYWPLIFSHSRGAFSHPFQYRPHDLYDTDFLGHRLELYQQLQEKLPGINGHTDALIQCWQDKMGISNAFVYWQSIDEELITLALQRIPATHWQTIFDRIWKDPKSNSSGLPDLIHFPDAGGYELVEVKGPGDKLQKNQQRWMAYFQQHGIPHKVMHVDWIDAT